VKKIADFKNFLKKAQGQASTMKKFSRAMVKAKTSFYQEFGNFVLINFLTFS